MVVRVDGDRRRGEPRKGNGEARAERFRRLIFELAGIAGIDPDRRTLRELSVAAQARPLKIVAKAPLSAVAAAFGAFGVFRQTDFKFNVSESAAQAFERRRLWKEGKRVRVRLTERRKTPDRRYFVQVERVQRVGA